MTSQQSSHIISHQKLEPVYSLLFLLLTINGYEKVVKLNQYIYLNVSSFL